MALRPVLARSTPVGDSDDFHTYRYRFPRRLEGRQRALRRSPTPSRQVRDAPEARSGVVAGAGAVAKRRPVPIGGSACWRGSLFSLDSVMNARLHEFAMLFCSIWRPGRAVEGGKRYQMATYTSAWRRMDTIDLSEAASHRGSAFLAPGRHDGSTTRLEVSFFLATHASRIAGR